MLRFVFFALLVLISFVNAQRRPIVLTTEGLVEGSLEISGFFHTYYAFKGIPYAEPPVNNLRFRNPIPAANWTGVRDATKHGNVCPNNGLIGFGAGGHEDCLYLNVYTPDLNDDKRPVMFWIYGGGFIIGDGNSFVYGPDLLLRENVVVVTFNYRLSSLGFLSTGDKNAQGNYALKDMVMALKWVKRNIAYFGGDPENVTIFGQSAGASSVNFLLLSNMSKGLFHKAIMQSGTSLAPFTFQADPLPKAEMIGRNLGFKFNSTEELMMQLRLVNYKKILDAERSLFDMDKPLALRAFDFVPSVETESFIEERFLTDKPINLLLKGNYQDVPMIIGTTDNEGLIMLREYLIDETVFDRYNDNDYYFAPLSFNLKENSENITEVANTFRELYFDDQKLSKVNIDAWAKFHTDAQFRFPADRVIKIFANTSQHNIYYYEFSYVGPLNLLRRLLFLGDHPGACHADDIFYLFNPKFPIPVWPTDHALTVRKRLIRLWTNFAKTGNPTSTKDSLIDKEWPKYSIANEEYLQIGGDLSVEAKPKRLDIWHKFQQKFTGHI